MPGGFVLVVGPSGAGKDTLLGLARRELAGDPRFLFARRVVTRESSTAEEHDCLSPAAFAAAIDPASIRSSYETISALMKPFSKSV